MERLKLLRKEKGLYQKDVANYLGVDRTTYVKYETGASEPDTETLARLADYFNVSLDYIIGRETDSSAYQNISAEAYRIPVYGNTAAGIPITAIQDFDSDDPDDWDEISEQMARGGQYIALRIKGDSMEPRMRTGDVVIVRLQPDVDDGDIAIVRVNGDEATCKKIKKTPEGLWLISTNTNYDPMFYSPTDIVELPVAIIGKVVELRAKF